MRTSMTLLRRSLGQAGPLFLRSSPAMIALLAFGFFILALGQLLEPLGLVGGLVVGLTHAGCIGSYLALLREAQVSERSLSLGDIGDSAGSLFGEVISVLFLFFLLHLVLDMGLQLPLVSLLVFGAISLVCNPVPELLSQRGLQSMELLRRSTLWMRQHGLIWLLPQALLLVPVSLLLSQPDLHPLRFWMSFGPRFSFFDVPTQLSGVWLVRGLPERALWAGELSRLAGVTLSVHGLMVFRACLFHEIEHYNPRLEAWRSKMN